MAERTARVGFIDILHEGKAGGAIARALEQSLVTGAHIDRHRRTWTMGQTRRIGSSVIGRLGAESGRGRADLWDEKAKDFRTRPVPEGVTTPFAINLNRMRMAFQLRYGLERSAVAGALTVLLNDNTPYPGWLATAVVDPITWEDFLAEVDTLERVSVRIDRPNPHYGNRKRVESLIEASNAEVVRIAVEAQPGESIDLSQDLLAQALAHVEAGYGVRTARGHLEEGGVAKYDSSKQSAPPEVRVPADAETGDALFNGLRRAAGEATPDIATDQEVGGDHSESER